jgi:hypothetical protein
VHRASRVWPHRTLYTVAQFCIVSVARLEPSKRFPFLPQTQMRGQGTYWRLRPCCGAGAGVAASRCDAARAGVGVGCCCVCCALWWLSSLTLRVSLSLVRPPASGHTIERPAALRATGPAPGPCAPIITYNPTPPLPLDSRVPRVQLLFVALATPATPARLSSLVARRRSSVASACVVARQRSGRVGVSVNCPP